MKRRFTEEQIIGILREQEAGGTVKEVTRRHGVRLWPAAPRKGKTYEQPKFYVRKRANEGARSPTTP